MKMSLSKSKVCLSLISILCLNAYAEKHPFSVHTMLATKKVGAPQISHDGKQAVFSMKSFNEKESTSTNDLWLMDLGTGDLKQLTNTPRSENEYQWSLDDKNIIFLRDNTIWQQPLHGNKATKLTSLPVNIETMKLSPDGQHIAFSSRVDMNCHNLDCSAEKIKQKLAEKSNGKFYTQLFVRHWDTWNDGLRSHLFLLPLEANQEADLKKIIDITDGWDADIPSLPFGGSEEYNFSADGKSIYFSAKNVGKTEPWSTNFDIFQYPIQQDTPKITNLTIENKAWDSLPVVSPDNHWMAYTAMSVPAYEADKFEIQLVNLGSGEKKSLTHDWDRSIDSMTFTNDSKDLIVTTQDNGNHSIYKVDIATGKPTALITQGKNSAIQIANKQVVYLHNDMKNPSEVFKLSINGKIPPQQLTYFNKPLMSTVQLGDYEQFSFKGWNDETVHGYIVKPADFNAKNKYPMAFLIHGGPQGSFYNQFHYRWNPEIYAAAGYVAVMIDFHGSTGYGQQFTDSIQTDWGGKPLEDLKKGFAAAVKQYSFIDGENACALGASYGGYMINWIASHWSDGFKCLVNHDGVFDNRMMYFATEELWFTERENKGTYFDYAANYEKHNPVNYVNQWKTPMFVIQGGQDFRIPESQSLGAFTALQRQNIESQFLYFPNENHWVLKPENAIQWHDLVLAWLDKHLKPDTKK